jgi:hypothetical protein
MVCDHFTSQIDFVGGTQTGNGGDQHHAAAGPAAPSSAPVTRSSTLSAECRSSSRT